MKFKRTSLRQRGLALISVIILFCAVVIIAGTIVYLMIKLCRRCLPPAPPPGGTNNIVQVFEPPAPPPRGTNNIVQVFDFEDLNNFSDNEPITLPTLIFPELAAPAGKTEENPFGEGWMEIERSTNKVNWETILVITNPAYTFLLEDDTNPPPDRAFYRGKFVYP